MRIYVASSWRNETQNRLVRELRRLGHEVYDFKNPAPNNQGFSWGAIATHWQRWSPTEFVKALAHPVAEEGFTFDKNALDWCEVCVLLLPCGRSAHLEAGYRAGQGKKTYVLMLEPNEPELMYKLCTEVCTSWFELIEKLR